MLDMPSMPSYRACIMKSKRLQYTLRNVPERTDAILRETAAEYGTSLNETALAALMRGLGTGAADTVAYHDLDALIGSWVQDPDCDRALADMDKVDPELWA